VTARVRRGSGSKSRRAAKVPKRSARRLTAEQARILRWAGITFASFLTLIAAVVLVALDVPGRVATGAGEAIGRAGFEVKRVDVVGIRNMDSAPVYQVALGQKSRAMPLVDVGEIRRELLEYGWVKDARVSRRLPDTLVVDIVERTPTAVWQDRDRLALIDADGVVIDRVPVTQMPDLPLLIGPGANLRGPQLDRLLDAAPSLKPQILSAAWVGGRRWDLALQTGETIALPEGEEEARAALGKFADLDKSTGLLGRGLVRFDLRLAGKMIVRFPGAPEALPAMPAKG
jgi:cell division protein FtsQ